MKIIFIVSIVIGIFTFSLTSRLPSGIYFFAFITVALVSVLGGRMGFLLCVRNSADYITYVRISQWALSLSVGLLIGISYGYISANSIINKQLPIDFDSKVFVVNGLVTGLVKKSATSIRFDLVVSDLFKVKESQPLLKLYDYKSKVIRLSYYHKYNKANVDDFTINTGDKWQLLVKLKRPRGFVNPIGFDYQGYLLSEGIAAIGYVKKSSKNIKKGNDCNMASFNRLTVACVRARLNKFLIVNFSHSEVLGMLTGLLIGEKSKVSKSQWQVLKDTGTIHLLAISGLHIGLAAAIGYWLGQLFQRCLQFALSRLREIEHFHNFLEGWRLLPSIMSMLFALIYSLLAGFSLPTQRALIMLAVLHISLLCCRNVRPWHLFVVALLGVALVDPLAVYSRGFWLSFLAVAALIVVFSGYIEGRDHIKKNAAEKVTQYYFRYYIKIVERFIKSFLKAQWSLAIGLFLPSIMLLKGVSGLGFVANFIAIPLVTIVTVPLLLLGILFIPISSVAALSAIGFANSSIEILLGILQTMQKLGVNFWSVSIGDPSFLAITTASIGIFYLLLPRGIPARWLGIVCFLPLFFVEPNAALLKLTVFDVGQGTAVIVETPDFELIYDTGKKYSDSFDIGEHILAPYLSVIKRHTAEKLMISHNDADHAGGVDGLLRRINVQTIYVGEFDASVPPTAQQCLAGQQWWWNNVSFAVVWPTLDYVQASQKKNFPASDAEARVLTKSNNLSCVLLIRYQSVAIILAGDIEKKIERQLINNKLIPEDVTLLLAPHHGSQTSSHQAWVNYLGAKHVVFSAGFKNSYGHPHKKVVARYKANNAVIYNTATDGAIQFVIEANKEPKMYRSRVEEQRYWHDSYKP